MTVNGDLMTENLVTGEGRVVSGFSTRVLDPKRSAGANSGRRSLVVGDDDAMLRFYPQGHVPAGGAQ